MERVCVRERERKRERMCECVKEFEMEINGVSRHGIKCTPRKRSFDVGER